MTKKLTVTQICEKTGVHTGVIRQWIGSGQLKATKVEGRWYANPVEVDKIIERKVKGRTGFVERETLKNDKCIR